jgi:hypothetical protein
MGVTGHGEISGRQKVEDGASGSARHTRRRAFTKRQESTFGWNYKPAEKHCWLIFYERKILFWLKK